MHSVRHRKHGKLQQKSAAVDDDSSVLKPRQLFHYVVRLMRRYKLRIFLIILIPFVIAYVNWPAPKLSQHANHWRDSGYLFKYKDNNVFYQDIIRLDRPIRLNPVLLILHGFPTSSYDWRNLIPNLQLRFRRIIIPDMLGLGFSDKPKGHKYSTTEQASIMEELLSSLSITDVHILAHDYGDTVTQELVARGHGSTNHTFNIKSICLTNGGILPSRYQPLLIQRLMLIPVIDVLAGRLTNSYIFMSRMSSIFGPTTQPSFEDLYDFWSIIRHKDGNLVLPIIMKYINERKVNEVRWVSALQKTSIPLHLIYGPFDPINAPDVFLTSYKELMQHSSISVLENTGHYPHVEDKIGFMKFYNEFLDKVERDFYKL